MKNYLILILFLFSSFAGFSQEESKFGIEEILNVNYLEIDQLSESGLLNNRIEAFIVGQQNQLLVDQGAISNQQNHIFSMQDGNSNLIDALQKGNSNTTGLLQYGNNNDFKIEQDGDRNLVDLMSFGNHNVFDVLQYGNENIYQRSVSGNNIHETVEQFGNGNILDVRSVNIPLNIRQTGGMSIIIR